MKACPKGIAANEHFDEKNREILIPTSGEDCNYLFGLIKTTIAYMRYLINTFYIHSSIILVPFVIKTMFYNINTHSPLNCHYCHL